MQPALAAAAVSGLYATCLIYGRLVRTTGCRKCSNPMSFLRRELSRRHVRDSEECYEIQAGGYDVDRDAVEVDCRVVRTDIVTYRCRKCGQVWEEKVELPGSGYHPVERRDL